MSTNRLAREKSPYLLQHQHNPVDWYPWGEEAFEKARREDKPIFLSIGYSTCHWCHVMERESFENEALAELLNADFLAIKVDREERPDVDQVYMKFVQATTGSGGWPLNVFLTPDLIPFWGGTYFPPVHLMGRIGFGTLLGRIAAAWKADRGSLVARGQQVLNALRAEPGMGGKSEAGIDAEPLRLGLEQLTLSFDSKWGGFSEAPKFPRPVVLNFLFRAESKQAREMTLFTLDQMGRGGIRDHLGGGFHRYSVDGTWHVPHFEKMLYDQAQLAVSYVEAFQITRDPSYAEIAREILDYVRRDLRDGQGGFYSAEDADSPVPEHPERYSEGAFYLWTQAEIEAALEPEAARLFCRYYGVLPNGNVPVESDPHGEFTGKNILIQRLEESAGGGETSRSLEESQRVLLEVRARRPRPSLDDKIITAWNGLMISAFARAAQAFDDDDCLQDARRAAVFVKEQLWMDGRLRRSFRGGPSEVAGFCADYAFLIQGLLDLYEAGGEVAWLQWAAELQQVQDALFYDAEGGGYWLAEEVDVSLLLRLKEDYDGAEPSPNSVAALNGLRLGRMLCDDALCARAEATLRAFSVPLHRSPTACPQLLVALDDALKPPVQMVLAGNFEETRELRRELHAHFIPRKNVLFSGGDREWLPARNPALRGAGRVQGAAAAYVCEHFTCRPPVTTAEGLREVLSAMPSA